MQGRDGASSRQGRHFFLPERAAVRQRPLLGLEALAELFAAFITHYNTTRPHQGVDVTDHIETALASLAADEEYLAGLGDFDSVGYVRSLAREAGRKYGTEYEKVALSS